MSDRSADFRELLAPGAIRAVFQPIIRLSDLQPIGYEGLARFPTPPGLVALPPDVTLAAAARSGLRDDLEVACWAAMTAAGEPPEGRLLFVNVAPDALGHPGLAELADRLPQRLVIELTEQDAVQDIKRIQERLKPWIARGALVAVDDAGAGFTSLEYVAEIRPDFLKLCRGMVTGVDLDASREAVLRATVAFAREVGARIVAEGVERPEELAVLRAAEADFGQGWLFGRPAEPWPADPETAAPPLRVSSAGGGRLERAVASAPTVRDASAVVVEHLARTGLMPSVYLEQGGRLRCQASRGYWQVFDGMPASAGIIGRTFRTGTTTEVNDTSAHPEFVESVPSVVAELCVPLIVGKRTVGVINADSPTRPDEGVRWEVERCADLLARRVESLGGPEGTVLPAQRLARAVARMSVLEDPEDIVRETVASARDLARFESAMVALDDGHGGLYVHHAEGPFAVIFSDLDAAELSAIAHWVDLGTSSYTVAENAGRGFAGHEALRGAGAASLVVLPLTVAGERMGVLLLADRTPYRLATDHVELLELLAVQAAGGLRMAAAVLELRERAARDPLTGLGHHATFHDTLPAVRRSTPLGRATAVLIADVDGFKEINDTRGHAAGDDVLRTMAAVMRSAAPAGGRAFRIGGDEFALVFECDGPAAAEEVGWQLRTQARDRLGSTVSVGLALAADGEADEAVVARADGALYEVKRLGRDGVRVAP
ncbi:MAG TPA: EAL domain-containing protein [Solirubrobacteraceae bacterium]|nr:EAL domain-containing protein [Solirubrobacteraceae bacterium]